MKILVYILLLALFLFSGCAKNRIDPVSNISNQSLENGKLFIDTGVWLTGMGNPDLALTGDLNNDGKDDLIWYEQWNGGKITVFYSNGTSYEPKGFWLSGMGKPDWAGLADINGDGKVELLWYEKANGGKIRVFTNNGSLFVDSGVALSGMGNPDWASLADVNGDGRAELLWYEKWNNGTLRVFKTSSGNAFTSSNNWLTGMGVPDFASSGDLNGDGKADLIWFEQWNNGTARAFISTGNSFGRNFDYVKGMSKPDWAALSDVNGDGKADLIWYEQWNNGTMRVFASEGDHYSSVTDWLVGVAKPDWASSGQLNTDGKKEIIWFTSTDNGSIKVYRSDSGLDNELLKALQDHFGLTTLLSAYDHSKEGSIWEAKPNGEVREIAYSEALILGKNYRFVIANGSNNTLGGALDLAKQVAKSKNHSLLLIYDAQGTDYWNAEDSKFSTSLSKLIQDISADGKKLTVLSHSWSGHLTQRIVKNFPNISHYCFSPAHGNFKSGEKINDYIADLKSNKTNLTIIAGSNDLVTTYGGGSAFFVNILWFQVLKGYKSVYEAIQSTPTIKQIVIQGGEHSISEEGLSYIKFP